MPGAPRDPRERELREKPCRRPKLARTCGILPADHQERAVAILEIPFVYSMKIVRHRCRKPERVTVIGKVAARIPDLSAADAPVAAVLENRRQEQDGTRIRLEYRTFGGGLLRPYSAGMTTPLADGHRPVAGLRAVQADLDAWAAPGQGLRRKWNLLPDRQRGAGDGALTEREAGDAARDWVSDTRDRATTVLVRTMEAGAALVDGVLHLPSLGPGWQVGQKNWVENTAHAYITPRPEFGWACGEIAWGAWSVGNTLLRGDRLAGAYADAARRIGWMREHPFRRQEVLGEPVFAWQADIPRPEAFGRCSPEIAALIKGEALTRIAGRTIQEGAHLIVELDGDGMRACAGVKDACRAVTAGTPWSGDRLGAALGDLDQRLAASFPGRLPWRRGASPLAAWLAACPAGEFLPAPEEAAAPRAPGR
jgi:hypothetical protein